MTDTNRLKYSSCPHAKDVLVCSKPCLVEATSNRFWGSGLGPDHTVSTLKDYWPGQNHMGQILCQLHEEILESETHDGDVTITEEVNLSEVIQGVTAGPMEDKKCKAISPLADTSLKNKCDG